MAMDATPLEQPLEDALAWKSTGEGRCAPLEGLLTVTLAQRDVAKIREVELRRHNFLIGQPRLSDYFWARNSDGTQERGKKNLRFNKVFMRA
jgi:hypothetical protein